MEGGRETFARLADEGRAAGDRGFTGLGQVGQAVIALDERDLDHSAIELAGRVPLL